MAKIKCNRGFKLLETEENEMNKKKGITTIIVVMAMFCMMSMSALAATTLHISLGSDGRWTIPYPVKRTGNYSCVYIKCDAVYPAYGPDSLTAIQVCLVNSSGTPIMGNQYVTLTEGAGYTSFSLQEGYLGDTVYLQFRANSSSEAEAYVSYYSD